MKMKTEDFEQILDSIAAELTEMLRTSNSSLRPIEFENKVRERLETKVSSFGYAVDYDSAVQAFPDIVIGKFGVEVKYTTSDSWRSIANSIWEGQRNDSVEIVYVVYGKAGGVPEVKWRRYEDCVMHVRTSHRPRFEVDMTTHQSLFSKMGISYDQFLKTDLEERMKYIRDYARSRLKPGERLWWLEDSPESDHTLPIQARLYMSLEQNEKRKLRAEAAILCPQIVKPSRGKNKYDDVTLYLLTYHGVLTPQARDLFSAGSVALRSDPTRGGNYLMRSLLDIEEEMRAAAQYLPDSLFKEYWNESVAIENRIKLWLLRADSFAVDWRPSDCLFLQEQRAHL